MLRLSGDVLLDRLVAGILLRACGIGVSRIEVSGRLVALLGRRSTVGSVRVGLWFFRRARGVVACRQRVVELLLGHARLVEGVASTTVWQSEFDADAHILLGHRRCAAQRRMCGRGACDDDVAAQSVDVAAQAQLEGAFAAPAAGAVQTGRMTVEDTVVKTLALFGILLVTAVVGWIWTMSPIFTPRRSISPALCRVALVTMTSGAAPREAMSQLARSSGWSTKSPRWVTNSVPSAS